MIPIFLPHDNLFERDDRPLLTCSHKLNLCCDFMQPGKMRLSLSFSAIKTADAQHMKQDVNVWKSAMCPPFKHCKGSVMLWALLLFQRPGKLVKVHEHGSWVERCLAPNTSRAQVSLFQEALQMLPSLQSVVSRLWHSVAGSCIRCIWSCTSQVENKYAVRAQAHNKSLGHWVMASDRSDGNQILGGAS